MPQSQLSTTSVASKLAKAFESLTKDLTLPSESDYPYKAFSAELPITTRLTAETFRAAAHIGRRYTIEQRRDAADFFRQFQDPENYQPDEIRTYALLEKMMRATLTRLTIFYVGGDNVVHVRFYLFGRMKDGNLCGLKSISIET